MRDEDDGDLLGLVHFGEYFHHVFAHLGIQVSRGLVGHDQAGVVHQGAGDGHPLLLSAGKLVRVMRFPAFEPDELQRLERPLPAFPAGHVGVKHGQFHVLPGRSAFEKIEALENEADARVAQDRQAPVAHGGNGLVVQEIGPRSRPVQTAQDVHQRALPGAGRAHDGDKIASKNVIGDPFQRPHIDLADMIRSHDLIELDQCGIHGFFFPFSGLMAI